MALSHLRPPDEAGPLATWFAEAVREELLVLEKSGGARSYEVLSGQLLQTSGSKAVLQFVLADASRVPEDAAGRLKTPSAEYKAFILRQVGDRIDIEIEGPNPIPSTIPRGVLMVDDTALLRKLAEVLEDIAQNPAGTSELAVTIFHPHRAGLGESTVRNTLTLQSLTDDEEKLRIIGKACGSALTFVWGPPGTGKTFLIAHLITELLERGERILVASHTNAAVDQIIYATVGEVASGPLASSPLLSGGRIVRLGPTPDRRVPDRVRLEKVVEAKAHDLQARILELEQSVQRLSDQLAVCNSQIVRWERVLALTAELGEARDGVAQAEAARREAEAQAAETFDAVQMRLRDLDRVRRSLLFRESKVRRVAKALEATQALLQTAHADFEAAESALAISRNRAGALEGTLSEARAASEGIPSLQTLNQEVATLEAQIHPLTDEIHLLHDKIAELQRETVSEARVIFTTLTKNYTGKDLDGQEFDAVIVDEISMALPPLLFLVGRRAKSRVVLVGDFLQLPPIIRSDANISAERLRKDAFALAGIVEGQKPQDSHVLTSLAVQRRMSPPIADGARHLAYTRSGLVLEDHASVRTRPAPGWLDFLPENPLVIVDTADLHCWSGKQPGTLSRFNFYSANLAVELAAMAAAGLPVPREDEAPIGIVTPYAAQRRLLRWLVQAIELTRWAIAGTVHTFQGSQADLIIFDAVLDEPYWSSRLTNPRGFEDVVRDLNVAVTRAKHKLVFVGSSEWLNQHASPLSGLGWLWAFLKDRADLISGAELVGDGFAQRVLGSAGDATWTVPESTKTGQKLHELLDETTFFGRFTEDLQSARRTIFGLVPYFGEYRWPQIESYFRAALERGVEVTLVTPPAAEAANPAYTEKAIQTLRKLGAVVIASSGLHGKDIVLDERVHYTGSLNWASHRGRREIMHRTENPDVARVVLEFIQARHIRAAAVHTEGSLRTCIECGGPTHVVNQRSQPRFDTRQALKIGCARYQKTGCKYLRDLDERPPFKTHPLCRKDGRTKYRRVRRGRGEIWQCPKHPKECPTQRVVPGDPA